MKMKKILLMTAGSVCTLNRPPLQRKPIRTGQLLAIQTPNKVRKLPPLLTAWISSFPIWRVLVRDLHRTKQLSRSNNQLRRRLARQRSLAAKSLLEQRRIGNVSTSGRKHKLPRNLRKKQLSAASSPDYRADLLHRSVARQPNMYRGHPIIRVQIEALTQCTSVNKSGRNILVKVSQFH